MKTLHVEAGRHYYGGPLQVVFLLQGLKARGESVALVCPVGSAIASVARSEGMTVHEITMKGDLDIGLVGRLRAVIRTEQPDVVHLHSRRGCDVWGALAARLERVPVVLSRRVDNPEPRGWFPLKYSLYDHVVAISDGVKKVLLHAGLAPTKVTRVHDAVDSARFRPGHHDLAWFRRELSLADDEITIAMVAQFIARKGHRTLLAALPVVLAAYPRTRLLLFGQGPDMAMLRRYVAAVGLTHHVVFAGFRTDLERLLPCVDVLAHPALMEGLGVALLQAAACGVPIVAGRTGGVPEVVQPGINGELIEPGDALALAEHLIRLLRDATLRRRYGTAGRALAVNRFSIDAMVDGNLAVYRMVCEARAHRMASHGWQH
jgi:glycosyltransferase involved in cell wall biosynthesis